MAAKAQEAKAAMAAGQYQRAAAMYRDLARLLPEDTGIARNLGLALYSAGQYGSAAKVLSELVKKNASDPAAWFLLGMAAAAMDEPASAAGHLTKAVALQPANPVYRFELGDALLAAGRPAQAIIHFSESLRLRPGDPDARYGLGTAYTALSRREFAALERVAPESGYWFALLAKSRAEQNQNGSALYFYREALRKGARLHGLHAAAADIYRRAGHPDWASLEDEREKNAGRPDCRSVSLECRFLAGDFDGLLKATEGLKTAEAHYWRSRACSELAMRAYDQVLALPASAASHRLRAAILRMQDRHGEAAAELRQALELSPGNAGIRLDLARALRMNQEHAEAVKVLQPLHAARPNYPELNYLVGDSLLAMQDAVGAVPFLERAAAYDGVPVEYRAALGRAYLQTGQAAKALPHLEAAAATDTDGSLCYLLAQAYARTGREESMRRALARREQLVKAARARAEENDSKYRVTEP